MAPLVAFPLIIVGVVVLFGGAMWLAWRLPRVRLRPWTRFAISAALFVPAVPVMIWSSTWASRAVVMLWIVNKRGDLSDGGNLGDFWNGVWGALMFLSFAWPILPLFVFRFITDRSEERGADTGEAHYHLGKVRQHHGLHAQARDDFQAAVAHFTSFLEYVEREVPAGERDAERIACVQGELQEARERLSQCEERLSEIV